MSGQSVYLAGNECRVEPNSSGNGILLRSPPVIEGSEQRRKGTTEKRYFAGGSISGHFSPKNLLFYVPYRLIKAQSKVKAGGD